MQTGFLHTSSRLMAAMLCFVLVFCGACTTVAGQAQAKTASEQAELDQNEAPTNDADEDLQGYQNAEGGAAFNESFDDAPDGVTLGRAAGISDKLYAQMQAAQQTDNSEWNAFASQMEDAYIRSLIAKRTAYLQAHSEMATFSRLAGQTLQIFGQETLFRTKDDLLQVLSTRGDGQNVIELDSGEELELFETTYSMDSESGTHLIEAMEALPQGRYSFVMMDVATGQGIAYNADKPFYSASSIKGPYVAAVNKFVEGASSQATMANAIHVSSNEAYSSLRRTYGVSPMTQMMEYCEVGSDAFPSYRNYVTFTAEDLSKLWTGMYWYFFKETNEKSEWCRSLYTVTKNSVINSALSDTYLTYSKAGWFPGGGYNTQNDGGIVLSDNGPYVIVVLSSAYGDYGELIDLVIALDDVHAEMMS